MPAPPWNEAAMVPDPQTPFVEQLLALVEELRLEDLTRIVMHDDDDGVTVWWKGEAPRPVRDLALGWPFPVTLRAATYSAVEVATLVEHVAHRRDLPFTWSSLSTTAAGDVLHLEVPASQLAVARAFAASGHLGTHDGVALSVSVSVGGPTTAAAGTPDLASAPEEG